MCWEPRLQNGNGREPHSWAVLIGMLTASSGSDSYSGKQRNWFSRLGSISPLLMSVIGKDELTQFRIMAQSCKCSVISLILLIRKALIQPIACDIIVHQRTPSVREPVYVKCELQGLRKDLFHSASWIWCAAMFYSRLAWQILSTFIYVANVLSIVKDLGVSLGGIKGDGEHVIFDRLIDVRLFCSNFFASSVSFRRDGLSFIFPRSARDLSPNSSSSVYRIATSTITRADLGHTNIILDSG